MIKKSLVDCVSRINQGKKSKMKSIEVWNTKFNIELVKKFQDIGIIRGLRIKLDTIEVFFKYRKNRSVFRRINLISKSSNRVYWNVNRMIVNKKKGTELYLVSTKEGLKFDWECMFMNLGGEVIVKIEI
jgi:ribosomal protein S8